MATFETVQRLALALPGTEESTWFRTPAFKVGGKGFARLREEGDILVVKVELGHQEALIAARPDIYFITPHYIGWPYILVRLATVDEEELDGLLVDAWRLIAPKRLIARFDASRFVS